MDKIKSRSQQLFPCFPPQSWARRDNEVIFPKNPRLKWATSWMIHPSIAPRLALLFLTKGHTVGVEVSVGVSIDVPWIYDMVHHWLVPTQSKKYLHADPEILGKMCEKKWNQSCVDSGWQVGFKNGYGFCFCFVLVGSVKPTDCPSRNWWVHSPQKAIR